MKKNSSNVKLWIALAMLHIVALLYPIKTYIEADGSSTQARFFAALSVIGVNFVLGMVDAVSIAIASA